jgi:hypothetical protein
MKAGIAGDDYNFGFGTVIASRLDHFFTRYFGHPQIGDDQVEAAILELGDGFIAIGGDIDIIVLKDFREEISDNGLIVNDEN